MIARSLKLHQGYSKVQSFELVLVGDLIHELIFHDG
jgi:hypothetical protein